MTVTEHAAPGASVNPVAQFVLTCHAGPVAGSITTLVNVHGWLPQLLTVTPCDDRLPTNWLPNSSASWERQKPACAAAADAKSRHARARRRQRIPTSCRAPQTLAQFPEYSAHFSDRPIDLLLRNDEGRREAYNGAVRVLGKQPSREQSIDHRARGRAPRIDLDADEKAFAANLADERALARFQLGEQMIAQLTRTLDELFVEEHLERFERHRRGERIAAEGAAVIAGTEDLH